MVVVVVVTVHGKRRRVSERGSRSKSAVEFEGGQCVSGGSTGRREWARRTEDHRRARDRGARAPAAGHTTRAL